MIVVFAESIPAQIGVGLENGANDAISLFSDSRAADLTQRTKALRNRMTKWEEADFIALFGAPIYRDNSIGASLSPGGDFAKLSSEARGLGLPGLRNINDKNDHSDLYDIQPYGRIEVFFGSTGTPVFVAYFLKIDAEFVVLKDESSIDKRLAWERPRFDALTREIDAHWRRYVEWEVDRDQQKKPLQGLRSTDPSEVWQAFQDWGKRAGYRVVSDLSTADRLYWRWYDGNRIVGEATRYLSGTTSDDIDLRLLRADGITIKVSSGPHRFNLIQWLRPDGTTIRIDSQALTDLPNSEWPGMYGQWSWSDIRGENIRRERDTNGDGLPDKFWETGMTADTSLPLTVERSWIVNSNLIPEQSRVPDQESYRLPIRRIPQ